MDCRGASRIASVVTAWALALAGCHTVETTQAGAVGIDREQTMTVFLKRRDVEQTAAREYARMVASAQQAGILNRDPQQVQRVRTVAGRLMTQTPAFREGAASWQWEANVVTTAQINAWCMLGGKIVVYTGLLDLGLTDDELAAVLGHEIAHSLREHLREVFGNRQQFELEADLIGVELAARAGYDPRAAMTLWYKLSAVVTARPSGWLDTHPSNDVRLRELDQAISRVITLYERRSATSLQ